MIDTPTRVYPWYIHALAIGSVLAALFLVLGGSAAFFGAMLWLVWGYALAPMFSLPALTYWHACVIGFAVAIVFGNVRAKAAGVLLGAGKAMQR